MATEMTIDPSITQTNPQVAFGRVNTSYTEGVSSISIYTVIQTRDNKKITTSYSSCSQAAHCISIYMGIQTRDNKHKYKGNNFSIFKL